LAVKRGQFALCATFRARLRAMADRMFLRVSEVAELLGVSRATAYDLVQRGQIPSVRLEGRGGRGILRVPADALRRLGQPAGAEPERAR
jgi:excisionase family DNA binding protein